MPKVLNFKVIITQDEDGVFVASVPSIPGCHSQGETYEAAIAHVEEAVKLCLAVAKTDPKYKAQIDFGQSHVSRLIGMSEVSVPLSYV